MTYLLRALYSLQRIKDSKPGSRASELLSRALRYRLSRQEMDALNLVHERRRQFAQNTTQVLVMDHGLGSGSMAGKRHDLHADGTSTTIRSLYRSSSIPHRWGVILFRLVRTVRPRILLELGTCLGVSASYLQAATDLNGNGQLTTVEGDQTLAALAREFLSIKGMNPAKVSQGRFQDVLPDILRDLGSLDFAFIDGHHEYKATREYYSILRPFLADRSIVVFDDVSPWFPGVRKAWNEIRKESDSSVWFDTGKLGVLIRDVTEESLTSRTMT